NSARSHDSANHATNMARAAANYAVAMACRRANNYRPNGRLDSRVDPRGRLLLLRKPSHLDALISQEGTALKALLLSVRLTITAEPFDNLFSTSQPRLCPYKPGRSFPFISINEKEEPIALLLQLRHLSGQPHHLGL